MKSIVSGREDKEEVEETSELQYKIMSSLVYVLAKEIEGRIMT